MGERRQAAMVTASLAIGWLVAAVDGAWSARHGQADHPLAAILLSMTVVSPVAIALGFLVRVGTWLAPVEPCPVDLTRRVFANLSLRNVPGQRASASIAVFALFLGGFLVLAYRLNLFFMLHFHNTRLAAFALAISVGVLAMVLVMARPVTVQGWAAVLNRLDRSLGRVIPIGRPWLWTAAILAAVIVWLWRLLADHRQTVEAVRFGPIAVPIAIAIGTYLAGYALGPVSRHWRQLLAAIALAVTLALWGWALPSATGRDELVEAAWVIEEHSWFSRIPLAWAQAMLDRDGDGYSRALGGGDCDERRVDIHPGAREVPDNGIDEDCSGNDLVMASRSDARALPEDPGEHGRTGAEGDEAATGNDMAVTGPDGEEGSVPLSTVDAMAALQRRWNIILLTVDAVRPEHLGYAGYHRQDISPHIDRLAAESSHFRYAYSCSNKTPSAIPPILASRWPSEMDRTFDHFSRYDESNLFLAEILRDAGYLTGASVSHWYFRRSYGFAQGFEDWREYWVSGDRMERVATSEETADNAIAFLREHYRLSSGGDQEVPPYFLWVHFMDPHKLYIDHEGFAPYGDQPVDQYDGEIRFVDHHIGRLLDVLDEYGGLSDTVVIFTSDHGEAFGEHGMRHHGWDLYEHQIRVPLFFRIPSVPYQAFDTRVSLMDLGPTILDLAGEPPEASFRGRSLLSSLATGRPPDEVPIFAEMPLGPNNALRRAFILGDHKLIHQVRSNRFRLFDLAEDPGELVDRWREDPETARALRDAYELFMATEIDPVPARGEPGARETGSSAP